MMNNGYGVVLFSEHQLWILDGEERTVVRVLAGNDKPAAAGRERITTFRTPAAETATQLLSQPERCDPLRSSPPRRLRAVAPWSSAISETLEGEP